MHRFSLAYAINSMNKTSLEHLGSGVFEMNTYKTPCIRDTHAVDELTKKCNSAHTVRVRAKIFSSTENSQ